VLEADMTTTTARAPDRNDVALRGRVAAAPVALELPSGDPLVTLRLVVRRPPPTSPRKGAPVVDTFDCSAWRAGVRRTVRAWAEGDVVEVAGSLRRRFWRGPTGPHSRWEIELTSARRISRSGASARSGVERA
jgi:single-strand DNA-binding protein